MRRLGTIVTALAVLLGLAPGIASAARKPPTYHCTVVSTPESRPSPVATPASVVVAVPTLRCTGRNPQHPGGSGAVGGSAGGAGNGGGSGAVGDGHIPFTGFPMDVSLALSLTLVAAGGLLLVLGLPRRRIA